MRTTLDRFVGAPREAITDLSHTSLRAVLVIVLTLVTGITDAIGFTRLGGVFTSVMTGNMVLMGVAAGRADAVLALHTGVAFLAYVAGGFLGARLAGAPRDDGDPWPRAVTITLGVELAFFALFAVGWWASASTPATGLTSVLIALNAIGLGVQSSAVLRFGVNGLSTTYLTGTLTTVLHSVARRESFRSYRRSVAILAALIVGAAIGAVVAIRLPPAAPAFQLVPLGAVVAIGALVFWRRPASSATPERARSSPSAPTQAPDRSNRRLRWARGERA